MPETTFPSTVDAPTVCVAPRAARTQRVKHWELIGLASEGLLARVFRARPVGSQADRPAAYAIKMLRPERENDPQAVAWFCREGLVGKVVSHPHLVSVLSFEVQEPPRFLVLPWLEGTTLARRLAAGQTLDVPQVLWIARQVAEALEALNAADWMHGDVKPSNIFISPEWHVTLIDLGFAQKKSEAASVAQRCVAGTCHYIAPERITSALRSDIRGDMYSLGAVLFEAFAGRPPFLGHDLADLATQHREAAVPDLRQLAPHVPGSVVNLVRRMLAKEPLRRPQTPAELITELAALEIETFAQRRTA